MKTVTKMHINVYFFSILNCAACLRTDLVSLLPAPCCSVHVDSVFDVTSPHKQLLCHLQAINTQNTHSMLSGNIKHNLNTISSLYITSQFTLFWHISLKIKQFRSYKYMNIAFLRLPIGTFGNLVSKQNYIIATW